MAIIIVPPTLDWNWMKQRPQHLMSRLAAAGHTVFYCDRTRSVDTTSREIEPRLYRVQHHERWLSEEWLSIRRSLQQQPVVVWCLLPRSPAELYQAYQPDCLVYDCADDCPEWYALERELACAADLIVCSSEALMNRLRRNYPSRDVLLVRNGYDPEMGLHLNVNEAQDGTAPSPSTHVRPQIGYVGAWAPWVDKALVRELAKRLDVEVTIIGPAFGRKLGSAAGDEDGRIRYLGLKRHEDLAGWIRRFNVCLIPFRQVPIALSANPIKAYEYMAAGKPVVSTDLPECRLMHPHVDVAANRQAFIREVARRLEEPGDEAARRQYALNNTWGHRAADIDSWFRMKQFA